METTSKTMLTIESTVNAPAAKVWNYWTQPEHIKKWNSASEDWHTPHAESDLRVGGKYSSRMEAKDGSLGFDFWGIFDAVEPNKYLESTMGDGRKIQVTFTEQGNNTHIKESFEPENENPHEFQQAGWQAILNNFKKYTEAN